MSTCKAGGRGSSDNEMSDEQTKIHERVTTVCGETITVFSCDGWRWFSDRREAERAQLRHEQFKALMKASIMRSDTFSHADQRIGRRSRRQLLAEKEKAAQKT